MGTFLIGDRGRQLVIGTVGAAHGYVGRHFV
jgi:hypothetical protein